MSTSSYIQWCNENSGRSYPIREGSTLLDDNGVSLPNNIILDMCLSLPPVHEICYISSLRITPTTISMGVSSTTSGLFVFTSAWADLLASNESGWRSYPLVPVISDITGWVVFNQYTPSMIGNWRFSSYGQTGIESRAVRIVDSLPIHNMVRSDMDSSLYFGGVIKLKGGSGVQIVKDPLNPQKIIVKLTPDAQIGMLGPCNNQATPKICGVPPLRSINGVCADANGKITLRFE